MQTRTWPAVAKLNLFLHIVGRREDGYHELQTLFQLLDYGDTLELEVRRDGVLERVGEDYGISPQEDLCLRAARRLKEVTGCELGASISIDKRIPIGGGLGGGSSDAATTLLALNQEWQLGLDRQALADIGLGLGADVPVFVMGHSAWAEGIGERLTPISLPEQWFVVLTPPVFVSTAEVFSHKDLTRDSDTITIRDFRAGSGENQLEAVVREEYPEVDNLLNWLEKFGCARMTGTGGSVFLPVIDESAGMAILTECPLDAEGFVARGVDEHPLLGR